MFAFPLYRPSSRQRHLSVYLAAGLLLSGLAGMGCCGFNGWAGIDCEGAGPFCPTGATWLITELFLTDTIVRTSDVSMNNIAAAVVSLFRNVAAPLLPNSV